jgi:CRISPR-associated protein (TIGR02584 family)
MSSQTDSVGASAGRSIQPHEGLGPGIGQASPTTNTGLPVSAPRDVAGARRRILLAVTGLSPQIVTETVYALAVKPANGAPWVPTEIHVITTARGAENARLQLLHPDTGWFQRLVADYGLPDIRFAETDIHLLRRPDGTPLDDIRDDADNRLAADAIAELVRTLSDDPDCEIHASIAGGRKTMGFFLGYAMSLFGRPQDRMSHVLVSSPFESSPQFFYPTPRSHVIPKPGSPNEALDASAANVWLGDIPFVRLRSEIPRESLLRANVAFDEAVRGIQESITPSRVTIRRSARSLQIGGQVIVFKPTDLAFLLWVITRQRAGNPVRRSVRAEQAYLDGKEYLALYQGLQDDPDDTQTPTHARLAKGMEVEFFSERLSRLKRSLCRVLGEARALHYLPRPSGPRGQATYRLGVDVDNIEIA